VITRLRLFVVLCACLGTFTACSGSASGGGAAPGAELRQVSLLHVSYDPTRELFEEVNTAFARVEREQHQLEVDVRMSHGGSGRQARAVIDGLPADVVSLALAYDVDALAREAQLLPTTWIERLPQHSSPFYSTIVMVVRRGNPRGIHGWGDLVTDETQIVTANPRTSGGARWAYLAAYGWALHQPGGTDASATELVRELYRRVPVLDSGARGASTTFAQNGIGDVLLTWENEAHMLLTEMADAGLEIVVPTESVLAEPSVAWIDHNVEANGTGELARRYLDYLYTAEAQEIAARHHYRVRDTAVAAAHVSELPTLTLFTIDETFGGWAHAHATHFAEGATFDRITTAVSPE
jgi:sulfate/thiosulfate-binding protein